MNSICILFGGGTSIIELNYICDACCAKTVGHFDKVLSTTLVCFSIFYVLLVYSTPSIVRIHNVKTQSDMRLRASKKKVTHCAYVSDPKTTHELREIIITSTKILFT